MNIFGIFGIINFALITLLALFVIHLGVYTAIGLVAVKKFPKAKKNHKYGILIAARNESKVIAQLIDSIHKQTYPQELMTVFVVADNCTDNTADIARECGAVVYERFDKEHATKGFAVQFLLENIGKDYGRESFEAYFIFDADNVLKADYIERMNEAFDSGEKIVTSYRNSKNIETNWIAAMYSLHFLRSCRTYHRGRSVLGTSTTIQGTGYMFSSEIVKNGWKYVTLTEDRSFAADAASNGYRVSYCEEAQFYDEQPTNLKIVFRQRIRWAKGHLQALSATGGKLFVNTFKKASFSCYDMLAMLIPTSVIKFFWAFPVFGFAVAEAVVNQSTAGAFIWDLVKGGLISFAIAWGFGMLTAAYIMIMERKRMKKMSIFRKLFYIFMFPVFNLLELPTKLIALFTKVTWKPIPHTNTSSAADIEKQIKE